MFVVFFEVLWIFCIFLAAQPAYSQASRDVVVQAQTNPDVLTATVNFSINDIRSLAGQQALVRRVRQATHEVCPEYASGFNLDFLSCRGLAWAGAKPQIDRAIKRATTMADTGAPMSISIGIIAAK